MNKCIRGYCRVNPVRPLNEVDGRQEKIPMEDSTQDSDHTQVQGSTDTEGQGSTETVVPTPTGGYDFRKRIE